jgi:excisionase family DNA binding protein
MMPPRVNHGRRIEPVTTTDIGPLLTPAEAAALLKLSTGELARRAAAGKLSVIRTPGGHRRYFEGQVRAILRGEEWVPPEP